MTQTITLPFVVTPQVGRIKLKGEFRLGWREQFCTTETYPLLPPKTKVVPLATTEHPNIEAFSSTSEKSKNCRKSFSKYATWSVEYSPCVTPHYHSIFGTFSEGKMVVGFH